MAKKFSATELKALQRLLQTTNANARGITALTQAAFDGDLSTVKTLLSLKADVNTDNARGTTALEFALSQAVQEKIKTKRPEGKASAKESAINSGLKNRINIIWALIHHGAAILGVGKESQEPFLFRFLELGDLELIEYVLDKKPESVLHCNSRGSTSLRMALANCPQVFDRVLELFTKYKGNINSKENQSILMFALKITAPKERIRIMKILLQAGADPTLPKNFYFSLITQSQNDPGLLDLFFTSPACLENLHLLRGNNNESLLAHAVLMNNTRAVMLLLKNSNFDLNEIYTESSLLQIALYQQKNTEIAKILIKAGARPLVFCMSANSLNAAVAYNDPELFELILEKTPVSVLKDIVMKLPFSVLHDVIENGSPIFLKILLKFNKKNNLGIEVTQLKENNYSVLFLIFLNKSLTNEGRLEILKLLIQFFPEEDLKRIVNVQDSDSQATALHAACLWNDPESMSILLKLGADQNIVDDYEQRPIQLVVYSKHLEQLRVLLNPVFHPDIHYYTENTGTLLMLAAEADSPECMGLLLERGIALETQPVTKQTALHLAAYKGNTACVQKLIVHKADMEAMNPSGMTPLQLAVYNGKTEMVRLLLNAGANIHTRNHNKKTILMTAAYYADLNCLKVICEDFPKIKVLLNEKSELGLTALDYAKNPDIVEYLRSIGCNQGRTFNCREQIMNALTGNGKRETIEELIKVFDLKNDSEFEMFNEVYFPIHVYANHARLELKLIILKHRLYQTLNSEELPKDLIDRFIEILPQVCQDFYFSEKGHDLKIIIQNDSAEQTINLSSSALEIVLKNLRQHKYQATSTKMQRKMVGLLKAEILKYSTENKAILEDAEINDFKNKMLNKQQSLSNLLQRDWQELILLKEKLIRTGQKPDDAFETIETAYNDLFMKLRSSYDDTGKLIDASLRVLMLRKNLESKIAEFSALISEREKFYNQLKEYSNSIKQKEAGLTQTKPAKKSPGDKKGKQKTQPKKQAEASLPKPDILTPPKNSQTAVLFQELARTSEKQKAVFSKAKISAYLPTLPKPIFESEPSYRDQARTFLKAPRFTLEHATNMGSLLRSKESLQEFKRTAEQVEVKTRMDDETRLQGLFGSLAQALESRKGLKEKWPDHIRNIIFKHEPILKKRYTEEKLIELITKINQKIEQVATPEYLLKTSGRLNLEQVDVEGFLKEMVDWFLMLDEFTVPKFDLKLAREMIELSRIQIKKFKIYILEQGGASFQNDVLLHAIGFAWARKGTYYSEIEKNAPRERVDAHSNTYRTFGNQYRHNDPAWKPAILKFVKKTLNDFQQRPLTLASTQGLGLTGNPAPILHSSQALRVVGNTGFTLSSPQNAPNPQFDATLKRVAHSSGGPGV